MRLDLRMEPASSSTTIAGRKRPLVTTDGRYELERFLHSVPLPFRISETRDYKANYYSTTLSGILAHVNEEGDEEESTRNSRRVLSPAYGELNLPGIGRLPYKLFLLKEDYDSRQFSARRVLHIERPGAWRSASELHQQHAEVRLSRAGTCWYRWTALKWIRLCARIS